MVLKRILTFLLFSGLAAAQNPPVPSNFQSLYDELQGKLNEFDSAVDAQWTNQTKYATTFSGELLSVNSNRGKQVLQPSTVTSYQFELQAMQKIGMEAVTIKIGYPLLYQSFLEYNGDPDDLQPFIDFYKKVVNDVHAAGMKVIVESAAIFPGYYSQGSGLNLEGYFATLTYDEYLNGAAATNQAIVEQIQPDYLNVGSEPDTQSKNTGLVQISQSPADWANTVNAYMSKIPKNSATMIGAGVGSWFIADGSSWVSTLIDSTDIDYIDFHIFPINTPPNGTTSIWQNTINLVNQAVAAGKPVAFSECWLLKTSDATYQQANASSDPTTFSLDNYSFWQPLDQQFIQTMWKLANAQQFVYLSPFWTNLFWAYLDYDTVLSGAGGNPDSIDPAKVQDDATAAAGQALMAGTITSTGTNYGDLRAQNETSAVAVLSTASFRTGQIAPGSLVAIFGSGLATETAVASGSLTTTLGNTKVTVTDSTGTPRDLMLIYASPTQVNAVMPADLASGEAAVTIQPNGGTAVMGGFIVSGLSPGIFTANASGSGAPAAQLQIVHPDESITYDSPFEPDAPYGPKPIDVSNADNKVYLVIYGTGLRNIGPGGSAMVYVGDQTLTPDFSGAQPEFSGLDQVNVYLPPALAGQGTVNLTVVVNGVRSNAVQLNFQ